MTHKEILALPAGPQLDALVHERVMGEALTRRLHPRGRPEEAQDFPARVRPYSTDIAAAWEAVKKLRAGGLHFELESVADADGPHDAWRAVLSGAGRYGAAYGPTAPLAISRAALLAALRA